MKNIFSKIQNNYKRLFICTSCDSDTNRRIFILSIILSGSLALSAGAFLLAIADMIGRGTNYRGVDLFPLLIPIVLFSLLLSLTRTRYYKIAAYSLILFYYLCATYSIYSWGFVLPTGLLIFSLITITTGIVISTSAALTASVISASTILVIAELQAQSIIHPDLYWINDLIGVDDAMVYVFILGVITAVAWLSNREIDKSLRRARESELALKQERDQLEIKVEERTQALRQSQMAQMAQLYRFAELGQMSAALLHDIANPLTTVSLNLEQLESTERSQLVRRARQGIQQMQDFIISARKQLQSESAHKTFSTGPEIRAAQTMLTYRLRKEHITLIIKEEHKIKLHGNEVKFQQLISNLLSNAIDAYTDTVTADRTIIITQRQHNNHGIIAVRDGGKGIKRDDLKKVFDPFFGTKNHHGGMGLGLAICRDIMEKEFHGTIHLDSQWQLGTTVTLTFPLTP